MFIIITFYIKYTYFLANIVVFVNILPHFFHVFNEIINIFFVSINTDNHYDDNAKRNQEIIFSKSYKTSWKKRYLHAKKNLMEMFFINEGGYYLSHTDKSEEFGFMFDRDPLFESDFPIVYEKSKSKDKLGKLELL